MLYALPITSILDAIISNKLGFKEQGGTTVSRSKQYEGLHRFKPIIKCLFKIRYNLVKFTPRVAINPLTPNDPYSGRTAPLTSKRCILYIYSTNIGTEY